MSADFLPSAALVVLGALAALVLLKESRPGRVPLAVGLLLLSLLEPLDAQMARTGGHHSFAGRLALVLIALIPALLLAYTLLYPRKREGESRALAAASLGTITSIFVLAALLLPLDHFFVAPAPSSGALVPVGAVGYWYYLGLTVFSAATLVNLESVHAGTRGAERWRIRYEFLGVGVILVAITLHCGQVLLLRGLHPALLPVRSGLVMVAALLIAFSRLYQDRSASLAISRGALYRSFVLVALSLFLLLLGFVFEGVRRLEVRPERHFLVFFAVVGGSAFLVLLFSDELRRRLKVLIAKHFYAHKYDYRVEWLGFSGALSGCRSFGEVAAAIVERYQQIFGLRFAALYVRTGAKDAFSLAAARGTSGMPGGLSSGTGILGYFARTGRVLNPADGEYSPAAAEEAFIRGAEAWLVVPLIVGDQVEALVVLGPQLVAEKLTYEDFDLMKIVGRQAALSLNNFRLTEELAEAREMAAVAKVSSFMLHDLKNLSYTFSLMMENAEEHIVKQDFQRDLIQSIRSTVARVNGLIAKLKAFPARLELRREPVDLARLAGEVLAEVRGLKRSITFETDLQEAVAAVDAQEFRKVLLNLLLNACDAVGVGGVVRVRVRRGEDGVVLGVEDNGAGMTEAFLQHHLFRPFRTTKEKGLGIGLFQCKQIVEAHGGRIEVRSREGEGTAFTVLLPREEPGAAAGEAAAPAGGVQG